MILDDETTTVSVLTDATTIVSVVSTGQKAPNTFQSTGITDLVTTPCKMFGSLYAPSDNPFYILQYYIVSTIKLHFFFYIKRLLCDLQMVTSFSTFVCLYLN